MNPLSSDRLERLRQLEAYLSDRIRGQDHVIPRVVSALHRGELGLTTPNRPRGSFLFLGPTGVGKTELSLAFTDYLLGKDKLFRFDMSEYQTQESLGVLLGGRIGETGLLGMVVAKSVTGTLLFDEIEKAHPRVLDVFLQILDAARVTMASGETLDLGRFYIVFTSNIAAAEIINLQHSSFATMELSFLRDKGFELALGHSVISFLMQRGFHPRLGARPLRDTVEKHLRGAVANAMLGGVGLCARELVVCDNELILQPSSPTR